MKDTKIKTISPEWKNEKTETISPEIVSRLLEREERVKQLSKRLERERLERERLEKERTLDLTGEKISNGIVEKISLGKKADPVALPRITETANLSRDSRGNFLFANLRQEHLKSKDVLGKVKSEFERVIREVESINIEGYMKDIKLSSFPVLNVYLETYVTGGSSSQIMTPKKTKSLSIKEKLELLDGDLTLREKTIMVNWFYRLLNLNMYYLSIDLVSKMGEEHLDLKTDLSVLSGYFYGRISASIREAMKQKGITLSKNLYCGFDTEYKNIDMRSNEILSAQWAVNSKVVLTIPSQEPYSLSGMNTHSGEEYPINSMWFDQSKINFNLLEGVIRSYISSVRFVKGYSSTDESVKALTAGLVEEGLPYYKDSGKLTFSFSRNSIKSYFKTTDLSKLDLSSLVSIGLDLGSKGLDSQESEVYDLLRSLKSVKKLETEDLLIEKGESNFANLKVGDLDRDEITDLVPVRKLKRGYINRGWSSDITEGRISVTTRRNFYLIGHLTQADLSLLSNFEEFKNCFDIINKSLVSLGDSKLVFHGYKLSVRDTMLLAPGGKKSLAAIGSMYGLNKIGLSEEQHENMGLLLKENPVLFKDYALRDALISLIHAQSLEDAHFRLHKASIPLTLSMLGGSNLRKAWKEKGYSGYQISKDTLLGDSRKTTTPKGLFQLGDVGLALNSYIANYKGGRNESFMIGEDNGSVLWRDYDLTAAYASAMCMLGNPNYSKVRSVSSAEIKDLSGKELLYSYSMVKVNFEFPEGTVYPSIPCYADETTTVYPLKGSALLTGSEYLLAKSQGCDLEVLGGWIIPYTYKSQRGWVETLVGSVRYEALLGLGHADDTRVIEPSVDQKLRARVYKFLTQGVTVPKGWIRREIVLGGGGVMTEPITLALPPNSSEEEDWMKKGFANEEAWMSWTKYKKLVFPHRDLFDCNNFSSLYMDLPFSGIILDLQRERLKYKKGTIENLLYKEMGNSLYGSVAKGISNKMRYDIKLGRSVRMEAGSISNPIMASYITGAVRSLIGSFLSQISELGGKAVSVTTDGFITDQEDLEVKLLTSESDIESKICSTNLIYNGFVEIRRELSGNPDAKLLELKHEGRNLTSWTTRGQISSGMLNQEIPEKYRAGSGLKSTTGIQTYGMTVSELEVLIKEAMSSKTRTISYVSSSLRSIKEIIQKGGNVTMLYRDQDFRLLYNNNREVVGIDPDTGFSFTKPWSTLDEALFARAKSNLVKGTLYQRNTSLKSLSKYKSLLEVGIRHFIKVIFAKGLYLTLFESYSEIIDFVNKFIYESGIKFGSKLTSSYVSQIRMKGIGKVMAPNRYLETSVSKLFTAYVSKTYPGFYGKALVSHW